MRATTVTLAYSLGLIGLLSTGLAAAMESDDLPWTTLVGLGLMAATGSALAGFLARHWVVMVPPLSLAGLLLAFTILLLSGGPGDGGPAAVAAILLPTMGVLVVLVCPAGLGVALYRWLQRPASPSSNRTH